MSKRQLAVLVFFSTVGIVCTFCAVALFASSQAITRFTRSQFTSDPTRVAEIGAEIAEFDIPTGYSPLAFSLLNDRTVVLSPPRDSGKPNIFLSAYPMREDAAVGGDETMRYARQTMRGHGYNTTSEELTWAIVDIRGEQTFLAVVDGYEGESLVYRYVVGHFSTPKGRRALLEIHGSASGWDQELVDAFIASLR